ncbi:unnamed protein product [Linum tenue]|uniref:F-box domain-containing protein n=1 Tax=Linum tenue TaxID=586396 RepID=A0AAV0J0M6_9ROSI|nr:unnamed protein product [Linum tenue]
MAAENYRSSAANGRGKRQVTTPASISNFGDDLLVDVLIRLPNPRSAFRCKSICKRWNSIISAPCFSRRLVSHQRTISAGEPPLLLPSDCDELMSSLLPVPSDEIRSRSYVSDCFKDLLLVGFSKWKYDELGRTFILCNPFTKQWVALPLAPPLEHRCENARLVCEAGNSITLDSGDGEGEVITHSSDYRFRVVRMYRREDPIAVILDVFCSNSVEWTKVVLDLDYNPSNWLRHLHKVVVSFDGKLYWMTWMGQVVEWNPFRLEKDNRPRTLIRLPSHQSPSICVSQGALYIINMEGTRPPGRVKQVDGLIVWRLEEEGWKRHFEVSFKKLMCGVVIDECGLDIKCSELVRLVVVGQHSQKPEVIYLKGFYPKSDRYVILSCNLSVEELEFLARGRQHYNHMVFQPRMDLWPTAIPNYERLQGIESWVKPKRASNCSTSICSSQGALYMIDMDSEMDSLSVWRLEKEEGWRRHYEVSLKYNIPATDKWDSKIKCSELEALNVVGQHSHKPEIIYLTAFHPDKECYVLLSCNLRMKELEFLAYRDKQCNRMVFPPRIDI